MLNKLHEMYEKEIREFFEGTLQTRNTRIDHVWIVNHRNNIETLTVEPRETGTEYDGSQLEIAVRFPNMYEELYPYSGYSISSDEELSGWDTNGH